MSEIQDIPGSERAAESMKLSEVLKLYLANLERMGPYAKFFDERSHEMLDEKLEVLTELQKGTHYRDIPGFFDILEGLRSVRMG